MMSPSRPDPPSLGETRNSTSLLPCPDAGASPEIQFTALDAVHAHSGCAATENLVAPPPASTTDGAASDTWHLTGSGPEGVTVVVELEVHAAAIAAATMRAAAARVWRQGRWRRMLNADLKSLGGSPAICAFVAISKSYSIENRSNAEAASRKTRARRRSFCDWTRAACKIFNKLRVFRFATRRAPNG
jgi:hypothetical protein